MTRTPKRRQPSRRAAHAVSPADLTRVRTYPLERRATKVERMLFADPTPRGAKLSALLDSLPHLLKADDLRGCVAAIVRAKRCGRPVIAACGGHVIKCGLGPLLIDQLERGVITAIALTGGASIHDFELALIGRTSEDVAATLADGSFGMVRETGLLMNRAIKEGAERGIGMGRALGEFIPGMRPRYPQYSVLAAAARLGLPATVHTIVGGDTIHMHPSADGRAIGATTFDDFRLMAGILGGLDGGGVFMNLGSAVVMPEVFLKALTVARNLARRPIVDFATINMDMLQHYRPLENVVRRPTLPGGKGYTLTGHHGIMVPLLFGLVREAVT